jgi:hypothetical protein
MYQAQAYFNNTIMPATPKHFGAWAGLPRDRFEDSFKGRYLPTDELVESEVVVHHGSGTPLDAAEHAWSVLNRDDRPNGPRERSLCVCDLVSVTDEAGNSTWFVCKGVGFEEIDAPSVLSIERCERQATVA